MNQTYSGQIAIPLCLLLAGILMLLNSFAVIHIGGLWHLWPVMLIAAGLEDLFKWAHSNHRR